MRVGNTTVMTSGVGFSGVGFWFGPVDGQAIVNLLQADSFQQLYVTVLLSSLVMPTPFSERILEQTGAIWLLFVPHAPCGFYAQI
jgi:hypothetical protein